MSKLIDISKYQKQNSRRVNFTRAELDQLLSLYSRRVISGEWKDYAINQENGMSAFSVYRDSGALPTFTIYKFSGNTKQGQFAVGSGGSLIKRGQTLGDAISFLGKRLTLIKGS